MDVKGLNRMDMLGVPSDTADALSRQAAIYKELNPDGLGLNDQVRALLEENRQLRAELDGLRGQVARMERVEREVMTLVKAPTREKIVHDLRNVLNELVLLRAIAGEDEFK
jgi:hypothetical protein